MYVIEQLSDVKAAQTFLDANVRVIVLRVRCGVAAPKADAKKVASGVGCEVEGDSRR